MASEVVTRTSAHARGQGLSIQTHSPTDNAIYTSLAGETSTKMASTSSQKLHFGVNEQTQKREKSEALLNDDWRHNRRRVEPPESLKSAPPRKVKFNEDEMNSEMAEKMEKKKLRIDTSVANLEGVRRCRDARDSPLDPDFILTAPATKREFGLACYGEGAREGSDVEKDATIPLSASHSKMSLGPKQRVRLEWIEPAARRMAAKQSPTVSNYSSSWSSAVGSVTAFADSDLGGSDRSYIGVQHPTAELQEIKDSTGLVPKAWSMIDEEIRKGLARLAGFGIPISVKAVDESIVMTKKKRNEAGNQAVLDDPAIKSMTLNGQKRIASSSLVHDSEKEKSFDAMLYKLQRSSAHRFRSHDPAILACALKRSGTSQNEDSSKRRLSQDSGISGVSASSPVKASTLNPKATEFFCPTVQKQNPATIPGMSPPKGNRPSVMGFFDDMPALPLQGEATGECLTLLEQRVNDMEAHLRRLAMLQAQAVDLQTQGVVQQLNPPPGLAGPMGAGAMLPSYEVKSFLQPLTGDPEVRCMVPPPGLVPPPGFVHSSAVAPVPGLQLPPARNDMGLHIPGLSSNKLDQTRVPPPPGFQQVVGGNAPIQPPPDFDGPLNDGRHILPPAYLPPIPPVPAMQKPAPGQLPPGPASTPMYMNHVFGPKPVRKPRGPFRPGDPVQVKHQQEYEAYLEWRRANDLTYAQQCKARQQKRAERQRSEVQTSDELATPVDSANPTCANGEMNKENGKENMTA